MALSLLPRFNKHFFTTVMKYNETFYAFLPWNIHVMLFGSAFFLGMLLLFYNEFLLPQIASLNHYSKPFCYKLHPLNLSVYHLLMCFL